jgi:hypothetical protein
MVEQTTEQPITEKGILRRVSVSIFKILIILVINNFKEAYKKLINSIG